MKKYLLFTIGVCILFFSCGNETKQGDLLQIPVDIDQNISLSISEIAENITAIELELTDESPINPDRIRRVVLCKNNVIIVESRKILVFSPDGKYVRTIGSIGQGPGEYTGIKSLAVDEKNERLFLNASSKIICYDINGNFLKESSKIQRDAIIFDINYIDDGLLVITEQVGIRDEKGLFNHSAVYRLNEELQIVDSCTIRDNYFKRTAFFTHSYEDFLLNGNPTAYLYYSDIYFDEQNPAEFVLRDTLYRFEDNRLYPELKLKFKNNGIDSGGKKFIGLFNIFRSSRYVFALYYNMQNKNYYYFCYYTKTEKGYNIQDGFTDNINKIDKPIIIRPFNYDTEMFYYWHTHMKPDVLEEPNPTLYIGTLKK